MELKHCNYQNGTKYFSRNIRNIMASLTRKNYDCTSRTESKIGARYHSSFTGIKIRWQWIDSTKSEDCRMIKKDQQMRQDGTGLGEKKATLTTKDSNIPRTNLMSAITLTVSSPFPEKCQHIQEIPMKFLLFFLSLSKNSNFPNIQRSSESSSIWIFSRAKS